jgi:diamine N-acetyltransferase
MIIKKLNTKSEIAPCFEILKQHHGHIKKADFLRYIDEILQEKNYQMIGAFVDEKLVAIAGYWVLTRFYSGKYIQIGNMVVSQNQRNGGIGKKLLDFIENEGKKQNCEHFILDSRLDNKNSHLFYEQNGFEVMGYHFMKDL